MRWKAGLEWLAAIVLVVILGITAYLAIDPAEQNRKKLDAERKDSINALGGALAKFYQKNKVYPAGSFIKTLQEAEVLDLPVKNPSSPGYSPLCAQDAVSDQGFCFAESSRESVVPREGFKLDRFMIVYAKMESKAERARCLPAAVDQTFFVWSSADNRSGIVCQPPVAGPQDFAL
ncbi:hypothetical protein HY404_03590 [Candidatus Microgenomates bacterium]|nr:hypothetical protein [Candidatus Microgenomates bacterium]